MKFICIAALSLAVLAPTARYNIIPHAQAENSSSKATEARPRVYNQAEINAMTAGAFHPLHPAELIKCESQNTNMARMDSDGLMSYGYSNGTSTWSELSLRAGVSSTPMDALSAIRVADYLISVGQLHRWTCAYLTGLF